MKKLLIALILFIALFTLSCTYQIPAEKQCSSNDDCVAATCCHAQDTVNKEFAPDCNEILCTQECVPNTIDCEQGEIKCIQGECKVILL